MSDLFNNKQASEGNNVFNPHDHFSTLCGNGRIRVISLTRVIYKKGWAAIIEELLNKIKRLPIDIIAISSEYGQLEISFECYEKTQEVRVWRAIEHAKLKSQQTCVECGGGSRRKIRGENVVVICSDCIHIQETNGVTGTWLDKY